MPGSLRDAVERAAAMLERAGCDTPRLDAEVLVAEATGLARERVHMDPRTEVARGREFRLGEHIRRRIDREPVAYILGRRAFRRIELSVDPRVLIPRAETELLVEVALELHPGAWVHDVGTGSGAVALAIAHERPDLRVTGSDVASAAVEVAQKNAERLGLPVEMTATAGLPVEAAGADLVVANLPYVRDDEWPTLQPEIRLYEPRSALTSGEDGLDAIRELVAAAPAGTQLALEHAPDQAEAVRALLVGGETLADLAGRDRVTLGSVP